MPKSQTTEIIACSMPKVMLAMIDRHSEEDRHGGNRSAAMRELVLIGLREVKKAKKKGKPVRPVVIDFRTGRVSLAPPEMQEATLEELASFSGKRQA